jgi:hypothetical protein
MIKLWPSFKQNSFRPGESKTWEEKISNIKPIIQNNTELLVEEANST